VTSTPALLGAETVSGAGQETSGGSAIDTGGGVGALGVLLQPAQHISATSVARRLKVNEIEV
jgi:hypothetical protein